MTNLELSILNTNEALVEHLHQALAIFEAEEGIHVELEILPWKSGRTQLVNYSLFKQGADVSEVATTWLSSFIAMNAIRPFAEREVEEIGGPEVFLETSWNSSFFGGNIWSLPWLTDARNVYYRRDLLAEAGVEEEDAFQNRDQLVQTLARLKESGVEQPWVMPTAADFTTLHIAASWVWMNGGLFMSEDGHKTHFSEPAALSGLTDYFQTFLPYLPPAQPLFNETQSINLFREGKAAATISGPWLLHLIRNGQAEKQVSDNLGLAVPPGIPFVGGTDLVVWNHGRHQPEAIKLAQYLTDHPFQSKHVLAGEVLPARLDVLNTPAFTDDAQYSEMRSSLLTGRSFKALYLWGMVEDKLTAVIGEIWQKLIREPEQDIAALVAGKLEPVAAKLDKMFSG